MKTLVAGALGVVAAGSLVLMAAPAQALTAPALPTANAKFIPKTTVTFTGKGCHSGNNRATERARIALISKEILRIGQTLDIQGMVKAPGRSWGSPKALFGPDIGNYTAAPFGAGDFAYLSASKTGTYRIKLRAVAYETVESPLDGRGKPIYGAWTKTVKIKITKAKLAKSASKKSKERCHGL